MNEIPEPLKRRMVADGLRGNFEATMDQRVVRHTEISHHPMTPNPHFAAASAECIGLYTDGYFLSTVMVTQAVAEGIRRFILERNGVKAEEGTDGAELVTRLVDAKIISEQCADAFNRIYRSFRNDVHHMHPKVEKIDFRSLARRNISDLAVIEKEVFVFTLVGGAIRPGNAKYWDIGPDGTMGVFLRLSP